MMPLKILPPPAAPAAGAAAVLAVRQPPPSRSLLQPLDPRFGALALRREQRQSHDQEENTLQERQEQADHPEDQERNPGGDPGDSPKSSLHDALRGGIL